MRPLVEIEKEIGYKIPPCEYKFSHEIETEKITPSLAEYATKIRIETLYKAMMVAKDMLEDPHKSICKIEDCLNIIGAAERLCNALAQYAIGQRELNIRYGSIFDQLYKDFYKHSGIETDIKSSSGESSDTPSGK